jgi:hypothetical protein
MHLFINSSLMIDKCLSLAYIDIAKLGEHMPDLMGLIIGLLCVAGLYFLGRHSDALSNGNVGSDDIDPNKNKND